MQRYIKMRTKQNNSHFFLYYSRFAVPLHPQNVIRMKDICCIGHVTKDKIVTPSSTVYMAGGTSFYFAYAINQLPKDVSFSLITAMDPTEKEPVEKMLKAGNFTATDFGKMSEIKDYTLELGPEIKIPGKVFGGQSVNATGGEFSF